MARFTLQFPAEEVPGLADRFSYPKDDRDCLAAGAAARERGYYTREELILICAWKTDRSRRKVASNSDTEIEFATRRAIRTRDEAGRMEALVDLDGVGVPTASALLYFAFPSDYPILDVRALESLGQKARTIYPTSFWIDYLLACRRTAGELGVSIRTLDKALWQFSRERTQGRADDGGDQDLRVVKAPGGLREDRCLALLRDWVEASNALKRAGIVRTVGQAPTGEYAEVLVAAALDARRPEGPDRGVDLEYEKDDRLVRVQVKARRYAGSGRRPSHVDLSAFGDRAKAPEDRFDELVIVVFDETFDVSEAWRIPRSAIEEHLGVEQGSGKLRIRFGEVRDLATEEPDIWFHALVDPIVPEKNESDGKGSRLEPH